MSEYRIILGDCLKELTSDIMKQAVIITDPPYNINFKYSQYKDSLSDDEYIRKISFFKGYKAVFIQYPEETMKYLVPALGTPSKVISWCYNSNLKRCFRLVNIYNTIPDFSKVKQAYKNPTDKRVKKKLIDTGSKGTDIYDWWSDIQIVKNVSKEKTEHPCPIPEKLVERLILLTTQKGDLIIDPFMGGGTVGKVAVELKRRFIGVEICKEYYEIAYKRIENAKALFNCNLGLTLPVITHTEMNRDKNQVRGCKQLVQAVTSIPNENPPRNAESGQRTYVI